MAKEKQNDVIPEDDVPAGVKLSHVQTWVTRLGLLDAQLAEIEGVLEDAKLKRKAINKAREEHIHQRPDERPAGDLPILEGAEDNPPAGSVTLSVNLDNGGGAAVAVLSAVSVRLTSAEFAAWVKDFLDSAEEFV